MKRTTLWNAGLFMSAVVVSTASGWSSTRRAPNGDTAPVSASAAPPLTDATGTVVPRADYRRIASVSTIADALLLDLCEPDRVVSYTAYSARSSTKNYRFHGKPTIEGSGELEAILALRPDLVVVSGFGDPRPIARLREAGLVVFDLGAMRGLTTLLPNIASIADLIGHPERGRRLASSLVAEMRAVASDIPPSRRTRGMYLSVYGGHLFGGAARTSYADVLASAGLLDATLGFKDFPEYSTEQILTIDPDVIVTNEGMRDRICEHAGLTKLRACATPSAIVGIDDGLLGDPGPAMLDAAHDVRAKVYGAPLTTSSNEGREP